MSLGRLLASTMAVSLLISAGIAQSDFRYKELPRFNKVNDHLYRGAQPEGRAGLIKLGELGVKSVVNLRGEDELTMTEEAEAKALGLRYFAVPMPGLGRPSDDQIKRVLAILDDQQNWPVFIHCKRGADRTGTIVACYRISNEGWACDKAISEAKRHGMSWIEFGMRGYITEYHARHSRATAREKPETGREVTVGR